MRHHKVNPGQDGILFRTYMVAAIVLALVAYGAYRLAVLKTSDETDTATEDEIAGLADCLTSSGAKFYGAYWCSHCERQKESFGEAVGRLPFVECGVEGDVSLQSEECEAAGVTSYPTWRFADGNEEVGDVSFGRLAELSGCPWTR